MLTCSWPRACGIVALAALSSLPAGAQIVGLQRIGHYDTQLGEGAAEISSFDAGSRRLFLVNAVQATIDILDLSQPAAPTKVGSIDVSPWGAVANSVDAYNGVIAVAIEASPKTDPGKVAFFDAQGTFLKVVTVGALPDMVTFTPDGKRVLVANEGEPSDDYTTDPEGSISLIDLEGGLAAATVTQLGFTDFNVGGSRAAELPAGVRIYGPNATVAQDIEPEYVAIAADSSRAWVTLQENNALAHVDLIARRITGISVLGAKNHNLPGQGLDPSDRDDGTHIANWPVFGLYLPDAIAAFPAAGKTWLITANEGDARAWEGFSEETRVGDLTLDTGAFPNAAALQEDGQLGRLRTTSALGDSDGDGDHDRIYAFGARSFSIWNADQGGLVHDSGQQLEELTFAAGTFLDSRSDDKGPEPEGVAIGAIDGRQYAFVGLERTGGVAVFDVSNPLAPTFVTYAASQPGDESPEGIEYIPASASPNGKALLALAHEVSGTVAIYQIASGGPATGACVPDSQNLCLNAARFRVAASYRTQLGEVGVGQALATTADAGYFYFFDESNVELTVKVLDACALYGHYWVFAGGLTNLEVDLVVTDTVTGTRETYRNPLGTPFAPIIDLGSFACR
jgi:2',3'-cyclic-nucleotide 2'-phosphodiesterase/3'-nucleotidase/5'-nucleotidase